MRSFIFFIDDMRRIDIFRILLKIPTINYKHIIFSDKHSEMYTIES